MRRKILITFLIFVATQTNNLFGQKKESYYLNSFYFGTSCTFRSFEYPQNLYEFTWNVNFATSVGKRFYTGVQVLNIFLNYNKNDTRSFNIFGWFTQLNLAPYSKFRSFVELSLNKGNYYLPPNSIYPEINKQYYYLGIGGGSDIPLNFISKHLFLDLSFILYLQRDKKRQERLFFFDYNQYILGLNYYFGKTIEKPLIKQNK